MKLEERMQGATTTVVKAVFPNTTNHYDTLFGGQALGWMDEVAFIAGTRFARKNLVTVSMDETDFKVPIPAGTFCELVASVVKVGRTSMKVRVDVYVEDMYTEGDRKLAIQGSFTLVAVDETRNPIPVPII